MKLHGKPADVSSIPKAMKAGLAYVTEDRKTYGLVLIDHTKHNTTLANLGGVSTRGVIDDMKELTVASNYRRDLRIRSSSVYQQTVNLSGGNQQKVVIAKWLATKPRVIILDEPTKGIDIGSKAAVHAFMAELAAEGLAVIMVSSEIPEVLGMSDRVIVMREGRIVAEVAGHEMTPERLVRAAAGLADAA